jgi:hypothetical protein
MIYRPVASELFKLPALAVGILDLIQLMESISTEDSTNVVIQFNPTWLPHYAITSKEITK